MMEKKPIVPKGPLSLSRRTYVVFVSGENNTIQKMSHFLEIAEAVSPGPFPPKCVYTRRSGSWSSLTRRRARKYEKKKIKKTNARSYNTTTLLCVHLGKAPSHCNIRTPPPRVYIIITQSSSIGPRGIHRCSFLIYESLFFGVRHAI